MKHERALASEHALHDLAATLGAAATEPLIIYLRGELGAGKTTFARGFLRGAGVEGVVKSPTYTLVEPYQVRPGKQYYHFDLYRLSDPEELEFTGARDVFDREHTCLIEWPEKAAGYLPDADLICVLDYIDNGRKMTIRAETSRGKPLLQVFSDISQ